MQTAYRQACTQTHTPAYQHTHTPLRNKHTHPSVFKYLHTHTHTAMEYWLMSVCVSPIRAAGGESASAPGAHPPCPGVPVLQSSTAAHVSSTPHLTVAHHDHWTGERELEHATEHTPHLVTHRHKRHLPMGSLMKAYAKPQTPLRLFVPLFINILIEFPRDNVGFLSEVMGVLIG